MSPVKLVNVTYQGDEPCWTPVPSLDWQAHETKQLSREDADFLLTNELFKESTAATTTAPVTTEVNVSG